MRIDTVNNPAEHYLADEQRFFWLVSQDARRVCMEFVRAACQNRLAVASRMCFDAPVPP